MAAKLTQEQTDECKEIFDLFDVDEDGRIAADELVTALRSLGQNVNEDEARQFLEDAGAAEAASVDLATFLAVAARKANAGVSAKGLAECLDAFDDDGSGMIPSEQLRQVMLSHGDRLTEEEADELIHKADPRGEGRVQCKEFVKVLMNNPVSVSTGKPSPHKRRVGKLETAHAAHVLSTHTLPVDFTPRSSKLHHRKRPPAPTHGRGDHLPLRLALPRPSPEVRTSPSPPSSRRPAARAAVVVVAPKAGARGRDEAVGQAGGREGPLLGEAGLRRGASVGARRGCAGRRRRSPGPVLRVPARVRRHCHRRHRVDIRVHQRAGGVRRRGHRQPLLRAHPRLLRRHRHPDLRVPVVQGRADGEQGRRGARPQRRLPLTFISRRRNERTDY